MRRMIILGCALLAAPPLVACLVYTADFLVGYTQGGDIVTRAGTRDILEGLTNKITVGMTRAEVDPIVSGYARLQVFSEPDGGSYLMYSYWFGFLPIEFYPFDFKQIGWVCVKLDASGHVVDKWYIRN